MTPHEWIAAALMLLGAILFLVSALGLVRFPDMLTRMSAASKSSTLGAMCLLAGYSVAFIELGVDARAGVAIVFLVLTAPVAAHAIGRTGYRRGTLSAETYPDELAGRLGECEEEGAQDGKSRAATRVAAPSADPQR